MPLGVVWVGIHKLSYEYLTIIVWKGAHYYKIEKFLGATTISITTFGIMTLSI
jgi:hypothetical protein